jgi:hypothetical protein
MPKFADGHAKVGGRRKGTPNKGTERERRLIAEGDDTEIVKQVIANAKAGDVEARRVYFRFLRPSRPETYIGPIDYEAPKSVEEGRAVILELGERLVKREISVEAHDALVNGIRAYLGDKAAEQQKKLDELEDALRGGERP